MSRDDDELIAQYLKGDVSAFERLHDRYAGRLFGFLASLGGGGDKFSPSPLGTNGDRR